MPHATVPSPGLQALVLCGPGESLSTFTSTPQEFSKALVPIANRPMVWYPLDWCYRMGINNITLVTPPESYKVLEAAFATHPALTSLPNPKPQILAPEGLTQTSGTGELLRFPEVQKAITSDFVVLPCDLISELDGAGLVQQWMMLNSLSVSEKAAKRKGGLGIFYPTHGLDGISQKKDETDFVATVPLDTSSGPPPKGSPRPNIETVVMTIPTDTLTDTIEDDKGVFKMRASLSQKYGRVKLKTKHRDAHVYIFPHWVKQFAARNPKFDSISEDLMGWWAKAQWQQGLGEKLSLDQILSHTTVSEDDMADSMHFDEDDIEPSSLSTTKTIQLDQRPSPAQFSSRVGTRTPSLAMESTQIPPLLAYIQPNSSSSTPTATHPLIRRVDTSAALLSISLYLAKQPTTHPLAPDHKLHPTAKVGPQSRIAQEDSLVAENVAIGIRTIIKESIIGANCEIGNNVRLTRCLLMDGVVVGDGVQMVGCVVGRRARIQGTKPAPPPVPAAEGEQKSKKAAADDKEDRTRLTECEVAPHFSVEAGTEAKGQTMMAFDTGAFDDNDEADEVDEDDAA